MQNIIFFVTSLESGGIENYLLRFLNDKKDNFNKIFIFCKSGRGGVLENEYKKISNVYIIKYKLGYLNPNKFPYLIQTILKNNINVLCDFTGNFSGLIMLLGKYYNVSKRITFYRGASDKFKKDIFRNSINVLLKYLTFKYSTDILSNSITAFQYFYPKVWNTNKKFSVIYNGIIHEEFSANLTNLRGEFNIPKDAFVVGHVGRYSYAKNHETIIKVAFELVANHSNIYFILCGRDVPKHYSTTILERGLQERILLFNHRNDIPTLLNTFDCFYFPSITEGQPNALLEAMVKNIPFVASEIDSIKETVPYWTYKFLVPPMSVSLAIEKILWIKENQPNLNLSSWTIKNFDHKKWFDEFMNKLKE